MINGRRGTGTGFGQIGLNPKGSVLAPHKKLVILSTKNQIGKRTQILSTPQRFGLSAKLQKSEFGRE